MKKLILALAAVALLGTAAQAQKINKEALLQKIEKNEAASADAKKELFLGSGVADLGFRNSLRLADGAHGDEKTVVGHGVHYLVRVDIVPIALAVRR